MDSLIKQLGLEQEILELHRMGISPPEMRKKLRGNHPTMEIIPSVPAIYVFLRESKQITSGTSTLLTGDISQDVMALNIKFDELLEDIFRIYQIPKKKRKYITTHRKKIMDFIQEFEKCYSNESMQEIRVWQRNFIDQFGFIVLNGLTDDFPDVFYSKKAFELIDKFAKSV